MTVEEALEYFLTDREIHQMWNTAFDIATDALEKQIPKKPLPENEIYGNGICPNCRAYFMDKSTKFCGNCGQKIDWSEE